MRRVRAAHGYETCYLRGMAASNSVAGSRVGTTGNVIAALASFFVPGLGQLLQGRVMWAIFWFVASIVVWVVTFGLLAGVTHVISCLHAALYRPR